MAKEKKERTQPETEKKRRTKEEQLRKVRRRNRQWIGAALFILIVVGAVSIIRSGVSLAQSLMDNTAEKEEYTSRLTFMVWFDLLPFESPDLIDHNALKQAAIWGAMENIGSDNIERDDIGASIVPASEVNRYIAELFGQNLLATLPEHETFTDPTQGITYFFDEERQAYSVPATGLQPLYLPTVVEISREGNGIKRITVGYVSTRSANGSLITTTLDYENPARFMDYYFQRDGNEYYLFAMRRNTTITPTQPEPESTTPQSLPETSSLPTSSLPPNDSELTGDDSEEPTPDSEETSSSEDTSGSE